MSTDIRAELSPKNKWYIPKHRYYELKHFCLQYPDWKELYKLSIKCSNGNTDYRNNTKEWLDPVGDSVINMEIYRRKIKLVEDSAIKTDDALSNYILRAVTEGLSFTSMKMIHEIPCGKDMYYDRYRKFFYILDYYKSHDLQLL